MLFYLWKVWTHPTRVSFKLSSASTLGEWELAEPSVTHPPFTPEPCGGKGPSIFLKKSPHCQSTGVPSIPARDLQHKVHAILRVDGEVDRKNVSFFN